MATYCRNGHRRIEPATSGRCPDCGTEMLAYVHADPPRIWPVVATVVVALTVVGFWWWWMWLAPH